MKYFKYWVKESFEIDIDGAIEAINILSGSNISKDDARDKAEERCRVIERRIKSRSSKEEYKVPIKEYVEDVIDESNIITVCRYGAKILNTTQYTILDLDDYPFDFFDIFKSVRKLPKKERIVFKFLERLKKMPELGSDFRIYETTKGIRVIGKKYVDPSGKKFPSLMRKLHVDWLYIVLSKKQNCYRARISPKPYRMKFKTIKVRSPLDCESEEYVNWSKEYVEVSQRYSVVRHIKSIGKDFSYDPVIALHDRVCNAQYNYLLV